MSEYYENYVPNDKKRFKEMYEDLNKCSTLKAYQTHLSVFLVCLEYDREDLLVAMGRVERENGWKTR